MAEYLISHVLPNDTSTLAQIDELLFEEGITKITMSSPQEVALVTPCAALLSVPNIKVKGY